MITEASKHRFRQPPSLEDAVNSVMLAKQALRDEPEKLATLYETIFSFKNRAVDAPAMVARIERLLRGHDDLISSINAFLPDGYKVREGPVCDAGLLPGMDFVNAAHRRFGKNREVFSSFVNIEREDDPVGVFQKVSVMFRNVPELIRNFEAFLPEQQQQQQDGPVHVPVHPDELGFLPEPDEPECGPSYRRKPTEEFEFVSSGRSKLGLTVLNDDWIFEARELRVSERPAMDKREIDILECEDERYEMDMLIERGKSAKQHIDDVLAELAKPGLECGKQLSVLDLRYIEKLYGDQGLAMVDLVKANPVKALPIVRKRLEQKWVELTVFRQEMNRHWARGYRSDITDDMQMQCDGSDYYI